MAKTYVQNPEDVRELLEELIHDYRADLRDVGVTFSIQAAVDDKSAPASALQSKGLNIPAKTRINNLQARVEWLADVTIIVDGNNWKDWPILRQKAVLHTELTRLALTGELDDYNRPLLKERTVDFSAAGFFSVWQMYGEYSVEDTTIRRAEAHYRAYCEQGQFAFSENAEVA